MRSSNPNKANKPKIAYILHRFPVISETFIIDEVLGAEKNGIDIRLFSFETPVSDINYGKVQELVKHASYALNPKENTKKFIRVLLHNLFYFFVNPLRYIKCFLKYFFKIGKKEFAQIFYLCNLIKKEKVRHLHTHFSGLSATAAMLISRFLGIPFSFTAHAHCIFVPDRFLEEKLKEAKFVISISEYNKTYLLKHYPDICPEKIKVIHCGVDIQNFSFQEKEAGRIQIISGGRFVEKKGFLYLLKACKILKDKGVDFDVTIFGSGPLEADLSKKTIDLELNNTVEYKGIVDRKKLAELLSKGDIFILPSVMAEDGDMDGIPMVLAEAMASGLSVISTAISGIPELIDSGENGLLVEEKNVSGLAEAMEKLIRDQDLRKKLSKNARKKIENDFALSKNLPRVYSLFTEYEAGEELIKILYVNGTSCIGGAEISLLGLLKGLDKKRFLPMVALPSTGLLSKRIDALGIKTKAIPLGQFSRKKWLFFIASVLRLAALIRKEKISLVHANSIYISEQSYFAARLCGVPCICHIRDLVPILGAGKLRSIAFRGVNKLIAISEAVKKDLIEKLYISEQRIIRIYNGVDAEEFNPNISGDSFRKEFGLRHEKLVGLVARLSPEKGQEVFLRAAAQVLKDYKDVKFIIIGDAKLGSEKFKQDIHALTVQLELQDNVIFTGFRDDLPQAIAALDVVVIPSEAEPFGRVAIEALASARPVIASNSGALPEIISKKSGIMFNQNNAEEIKKAIIELLRNTQQSRDRGLEGRRIVLCKFSIDRHIAAVERLYHEVLSV